MLGIPNFQAQFYSDPHRFRRAHREKLLAAIGYPIETYYLQWELDDDAWNADGPIILMIKGLQYECCAFQVGSYHLSLNSIDMQDALDWYGSSNEFPLSWEQNPMPSINSVLHKPISQISLICWQQLLVGLQFSIANAPLPLNLINGLDQNDLYLRHLEEEDYQLIAIL